MVPFDLRLSSLWDSLILLFLRMWTRKVRTSWIMFNSYALLGLLEKGEAISARVSAFSNFDPELIFINFN